MIAALNQTPAPTPQEKKEQSALVAALQLAFELGYIIAIPAAVFGFAGAYADKAIGTSPLLMLLGLALAFVSSSIMIWRMMKRFITKIS